MEYRRTIEHKFTAGAEPALSITNRSGKLQVRGEERSDTAFTATLRVHADSDQAASCSMRSNYRSRSTKGRSRSVRRS
jgi:hypothetical protein